MLATWAWLRGMSARGAGLFLLCALLVCRDVLAADGGASLYPVVSEPESVRRDEGLRFACPPAQLARIKGELPAYLASLGIDPAWIVQAEDERRGTLVLGLNDAISATDTLAFSRRAELQIRDEAVRRPAARQGATPLRTVSRKEILLSLLQRGRLTEFAGRNCSIEALRDHVGIRQNVVRWAERLNWVWPDGRLSRWNGRYWRDGTPRPGVPLQAAIDDMFRRQDKYSIGCYSAAKVVMIQGVLDYYRRIKRDPAALRFVESRLLADGEPLVDVEPGRMWDFEPGFDPGAAARPGKILSIQYRVAPGNFVPGDWTYLLNTDPVSWQKAGYEGSNAIYLGRNKFVDYFNDHRHAYSLQEKANEVYQWRHGVFNRSRDAEKVVALSDEQMQRLMRRTPEEGGLLMDFRAFPTLFGAAGQFGAD